MCTIPYTLKAMMVTLQKLPNEFRIDNTITFKDKQELWKYLEFVEDRTKTNKNKQLVIKYDRINYTDIHDVIARL